ncbi:unnamed protein product, partial [Ectocarpus sp. 12 AP-2014]
PLEKSHPLVSSPVVAGAADSAADGSFGLLTLRRRTLDYPLAAPTDDDLFVAPLDLFDAPARGRGLNGGGSGGGGGRGVSNAPRSGRQRRTRPLLVFSRATWGASIASAVSTRGISSCQG